MSTMESSSFARDSRWSHGLAVADGLRFRGGREERGVSRRACAGRDVEIVAACGRCAEWRVGVARGCASPEWWRCGGGTLGAMAGWERSTADASVLIIVDGDTRVEDSGTITTVF